MSKVVYEFNLYEDKEDLERFQKSDKFYDALEEIYTLCRSHIKYGEYTNEEEMEKMIDNIYDISAIVHRD